jgi:hypothetical protein
MIIKAQRRYGLGGNKLLAEQALKVRTNPLGVLRIGNSIRYENLCTGGTNSYRTITDFLREWSIASADTRLVRLPFIIHRHGLGDVAGAFFARLGVYPKGDCGCSDRKEWWNWLLKFVPLKEAVDELNLPEEDY